MVQSQFMLAWDAYQSNVCKSLSSFQQNGEFVDMTLAVEGYLVKVHQMIIAFASPYLKELIHSAPCPHPVIFLNNVTHKTLCSLLEYIYTGEAMVPADNLSTFFETAKALHIHGLEEMGAGGGVSLDSVPGLPHIDDDDFCHVSGIKRIDIPSGDTTEQIGLPAAARKIHIKHNTNESTSKRHKSNISQNVSYSDTVDDSMKYDTDDDDDMTLAAAAAAASTAAQNKPQTNLQFTVSNRGSLQVILNRYIYNLHSTAHRTGIKRWRCVDYRNNRCMAFIITKGNVVHNRANLHNHTFHDKKILSKIEKKAVYSAIDEIEATKDQDKDKNKHSDPEEINMETQEYSTDDVHELNCSNVDNEHDTSSIGLDLKGPGSNVTSRTGPGSRQIIIDDQINSNNIQ